MHRGLLYIDSGGGALNDNNNRYQVKNETALDEELVIILDDHIAPTQLVMTNKDSPFRLSDCFSIAETAWMTKQQQRERFVNQRYSGFITAKPLCGPNTGYYGVAIYAKYGIRDKVKVFEYEKHGRN